jgi:hypothetical protein
MGMEVPKMQVPEQLGAQPEYNPEANKGKDMRRGGPSSKGKFAPRRKNNNNKPRR